MKQGSWGLKKRTTKKINSPQHTCTHMHTQAHTRTFTHTHIHTHTVLVLKQLPSFFSNREVGLVQIVIYPSLSV